MRFEFVAVTLVLAAGCGGSKSELAPAVPTPTEAASAPAAGGVNPDALALCKRIFVKQGECGDAFLPVLVDMRIKHNVPDWIAAEAAKEGGRDKLLATGKAELKHDSTEPGLTENCSKIAADLPQGVSEQAACLEQVDCAAYVTCVTPLLDKRLAAPAAKK